MVRRVNHTASPGVSTEAVLHTSLESDSVFALYRSLHLANQRPHLQKQWANHQRPRIVMKKNKCILNKTGAYVHGWSGSKGIFKRKKCHHKKTGAYVHG